MNSGEGSIRVAPIKLQERDAKENPRGLRYVAAFDGLRAMAVGSVLVSHMLANTPAGWISAIAKQGWYGVDVFFVLSGFLITSLLATELDRTQGINIPRFYVRRALRLQPAYFSAIILMVAGHWLTGGFVTAVNRLPYLLTYTFNIAVALGWVGAGRVDARMDTMHRRAVLSNLAERPTTSWAAESHFVSRSAELFWSRSIAPCSTPMEPHRRGSTILPILVSTPCS